MKITPKDSTKPKFKWKKRASGAGPPKKNRNHMRHGLFAEQLTKGCQHIENRTLKLRRQMEDLLLQVKGEVSIIDAAVIQTAIRWERHSLLCQRWLTKKIKSLSPSDRLNFSREIAKASSERDKCLHRLGLDKRDIDPWAALDAPAIQTEQGG